MLNLAAAAAAAAATTGISTTPTSISLTLSLPQTHKWRITGHSSPSFKKNILTVGGVAVSSNSSVVDEEKKGVLLDSNSSKRKDRVFFLDVNPLCYKGSTPSLRAFAHWISLFFSQVSLHDPVIAVIDGEGGHEHRKQILPSYKARRTKFVRRVPTSDRLPHSPAGRSHQIVVNFLRNCNVPVLKIEGQEADDVIATLAEQVVERGNRVAIASPDKDFKQLISDDVQLVIPIPELQRWSFYTLKQYLAQYDCDPQSDLSLRCIIGDEVDGVPGIQNLVPGFGRRTALKLLRKHGSLENLLNAAAVRTVAKQYAQDALTKYAFELRRNYQVLALRRDIDVHVHDEWLSKRDSSNDSMAIAKLYKLLGES